MDLQSRTWTLAGSYLNKRVRKPIIDLEPCTRVTDTVEVSDASALGIFATRLGGVSSVARQRVSDTARTECGSGIAVAHLSRIPDSVGTLSEGHRPPLSRRQRCCLRSKSDIRPWIARTSPRPGASGAEWEGLRAASTPGRETVVVYLPDPRVVQLTIDMSTWRLTLWDLENRTRLAPRVSVADTGSRLSQPDSLSGAGPYRGAGSRSKPKMDNLTVGLHW